jgi:DNA-directed RNA polymerase sigma subunit (sigma70/sigma32)
MAMSFQEKYESSRTTYTKVLDKRFADIEAGSTVVIASPQDIATELNQLGLREMISMSELRRRLATRHAADKACPAMTGMNLRIVAEVAIAALDGGVPQTDVTPFWNVIDPAHPLAAKLPGGIARIEQLRKHSMST